MVFRCGVGGLALPSSCVCTRRRAVGLRFTEGELVLRSLSSSGTYLQKFVLRRFAERSKATFKMQQAKLIWRRSAFLPCSSSIYYVQTIYLNSKARRPSLSCVLGGGLGTMVLMNNKGIPAAGVLPGRG